MARHEFLVYRHERDTPASVTWDDGEISIDDPSGSLAHYWTKVKRIMADPPKTANGRIMANGPPLTMAWGGDPRGSVKDFIAALHLADPPINVIQPEGLDVDIDLTYHSEPGVVY